MVHRPEVVVGTLLNPRLWRFPSLQKGRDREVAKIHSMLEAFMKREGGEEGPLPLACWTPKGKQGRGDELRDLELFGAGISKKNQEKEGITTGG